MDALVEDVAPVESVIVIGVPAISAAYASKRASST